MIGLIMHVPSNMEICRVNFDNKVLFSNVLWCSTFNEDFFSLGLLSCGEFNVIANSTNDEIIRNIIERIENHKLSTWFCESWNFMNDIFTFVVKSISFLTHSIINTSLRSPMEVWVCHFVSLFAKGHWLMSILFLHQTVEN